MRIAKPLTDADCRALKPDPTGKTRPRIYDGGGLFLEAQPSGRKVWRLKYTAAGRETKATFGDYPAVTLAVARRKRDEAKGLLADGLDVNEAKARKQAAEAGQAAAGTFEAIARRWYADEIENKSETYQASITRLLERDVLPYIGKRALTGLTPRELLTVFNRIKERGAEETARRARVMVGQVVRYAIRHDMAENDPTLALRGEKRQTPKRHFAAFTDPADAARLMVAIHSYKGTPEVRAALKLSALLFQRPGEIRHMQWSEIDFDAAQWRYIVSKTKTPHIVPLSAQTVAVLRELQPLTDHGLSFKPDAPRYVFPSPKTRLRPMSENAVRQALRNMGFTNDEMTAHGFRAMARTILHQELNFAPELIEHQLAHRVPDSLGAAYNRTKFIEQRRVMMQSWSDYLEKLKAGAQVFAIPRAA